MCSHRLTRALGWNSEGHDTIGGGNRVGCIGWMSMCTIVLDTAWLDAAALTDEEVWQLTQVTLLPGEWTIRFLGWP
jgi:hypothetical protein